MSSKINLQTCEYARKSSIFQDNQLIFIKFLTDANDLVLDPFAGSNTTGYVAESTLRRWLSIEINQSYVQSSIGRFDTAAVL